MPSSSVRRRKPKAKIIDCVPTRKQAERDFYLWLWPLRPKGQTQLLEQHFKIPDGLKQVVSNNQGGASLILILFLSTALAGVIGTVTLMSKARQLAHHQVRLDRCTGKAALTWVQMAKKLSFSNKRLIELRTAYTAAVLAAPETLPAIRVAMQGIRAIQVGMISGWNAYRIRLALPGACDNGSDFTLDTPNCPYSVPPVAEDGVGPVPLQESVSTLHFNVTSKKRSSCIEIFHSESTQWTAKWVNNCNAFIQLGLDHI